MQTSHSANHRATTWLDYHSQIVDTGEIVKRSMPLLSGGSYSKVHWVYLQDTLQPGRKEVYPVSHVIVTDEAFPLRGDMLRPDTRQTDWEKWVQEISCECSFRITTSQCRLFRRVLCASEKVRTVKATCMLHNFLRWEDGESVPVPAVPAEPLLSARISEQLESTLPLEASAIRETYTGCFSSTGQLPWQYDLICVLPTHI